MTALVAVLATLVLILLAAGAVSAVVWRRSRLGHEADVELAAAAADRLLSGLYVERVVITMKNAAKDEAFGGLLADVDEHSVLLRDAEAFTSTGRRPVDGELLLPREGIAYIQRPGG